MSVRIVISAVSPARARNRGRSGHVANVSLLSFSPAVLLFIPSGKINRLHTQAIKHNCVTQNWDIERCNMGDIYFIK